MKRGISKPTKIGTIGVVLFIAAPLGLICSGIWEVICLIPRKSWILCTFFGVSGLLLMLCELEWQKKKG